MQSTRRCFCLAAGLTLIANVAFGSPQEDVGEGTAVEATAVALPEVPERADFDPLPAGTILSELYGERGTGPVLVRGYNPRLGEHVNAAVIFDSANPTGNDFDLATPNEGFEIDGAPGPGQGVGGIPGSPYENSQPLGHLLIIAEFVTDEDGDGLVDDPDDMGHASDSFTFDFSQTGPVTVHNMSLVDVERGEGRPRAEFYDASGTRIRTVDLPHTGDNGVADVDLGPTAGVSKMVVLLAGSGAISGFQFEKAPIERLPQTATREPLVLLIGLALVGLGLALRFRLRTR